MKRNIWPRLAAVLLALTMASTSVIGGTLAKFVTSDSATDSARVAKFGLVATVSGDLFGPAYEVTGGEGGDKITHYTDNTATVTAVNQATALVAPGTKGGTLTISVKGTPEVGTKVTFDHAQGSDGKPYAAVSPFLMGGRTYTIPVVYDGTVTSENYTSFCNNEGIVLTSMPAAGTTVYYPKDRVTVTDNYYPLTWKVSINGAAATSYTGATAVSDAWAAVQTAINDTTKTPNTPIDFTATVTWEWPYTGGSTEADLYRSACDTVMGDYSGMLLYGSIGDGWLYTRVGANRKGRVVSVQNPYDATTTADQGIICGYSGSATGTTITARLSAQVGGVSALDLALTAAFDARITIAQVD